MPLARSSPTILETRQSLVAGVLHVGVASSGILAMKHVGDGLVGKVLSKLYMFLKVINNALNVTWEMSLSHRQKLNACTIFQHAFIIIWFSCPCQGRSVLQSAEYGNADTNSRFMFPMLD
jgi:hypothetical protein